MPPTKVMRSGRRHLLLNMLADQMFGSLCKSEFVRQATLKEHADPWVSKRIGDFSQPNVRSRL